MAAIIRRNRFVILLIICSLLLIIISWHFHRKEKSLFDSTPISYAYENFNAEIHIHEPNRHYSSDINKLYNIIETEQLQFVNKQKSPEYEEIPSFVPKKESTKYRVEEHFIPIQQEEKELTTNIMRQNDEKSMVRGEDRRVQHYPERKFSPPSMVGMVADTKYPDLNETHFTVPQGKKISLASIHKAKEEFVIPDWENAIYSEIRNKTDTIGMSDMIMHVMLNQADSPPHESKYSPPHESKYSPPHESKYSPPHESKDSPPHKSKDSPPHESHIANAGKATVLLIDTPGCKIPRLDPWDPTVRDLIELQDPYVCPGPPVFMNSNPGGSISLNTTILKTYYNMTPEGLFCNYTPIYRMHEEDRNEREINFGMGENLKLEFDVPLGQDYISVSCNGKQYEQYFPLVPLKEHVEIERYSRIPPNPTLNVILVGIDSVSKLNFLRHFPRTHAFLNDKLKPFEMNGYTKVGDNTFPNLVPMLTGQFVEHWWNETVKDTMFFDDIGLIWKEYAKRGYRTFFAEDNPFSGTFNYIKRGFYDPPTDYYFRPMALAMEMWKFMINSEKEFCFKSQIDFDIIYKYLQDFAETMGSRPYFGFAMVSTITHDKLNYAGWADEPTVRLLEGLLNSGSLNNTLLVLFSDHGLRFGKIRHTYVGKFEERLPMMYIHVPKWFLDQYPEIARNLQTNQDRLMTLFDIHATMLHLLDLSKHHAERSKVTLGTSLFEEISPNRTCKEAYIQTHWCPCQEFDIVDSNSPEAINASQAIVDDINFKLESYGGLCEVLEVATIMDARVGKANDIMLQYLRTENEVINRTVYVGDEVARLDDYMITLVTKPGGAVFEGTVRHNAEDNSYSVLGLSRISMYGNTSWCIDSQKMKIFCYCKIQQQT